MNRIKESILARLRQAFGEDYAVLSETPPEAFVTSYFLVLSTGSSVKRVLGKRYFLRNPFEIHFVSNQEEGVQQELDRIGEMLFKVLDFIELDSDFLRAWDMKSEKRDNELVFRVEYNLHVIAEVGQDPMEILTLQSGTRQPEAKATEEEND